MADRLKSIKRILAVQKQLHRLSQWKLGELVNREEALKQRHEELVLFTDEDGSYGAVFSNALMRRLRALGEERSRVGVMKENQSVKMAKEAQKLGRAESLKDKLESEKRAEDERKELRDNLERIVSRYNASSR